MDSLQSFYWVVKLGSIIAASEHLSKSQPTLSNHIKHLEEYYGTELLSRTRGGIKPTRQGQVIFKMIEKPIDELIKCKDIVALNEAKGPLHILTFVGLGSQWLVKYLDGFLQKYPEININLDLKDISHTHYINFDKYDVIIGPYQQDRSDIIQNELVTSRLNLYASKEYLKKYGNPKDIDDLVNHRILGNYTSSFHDERMVPHDWIFYSQKEHKIKPYLSINSTMALAKLCAEGIGIAPIVDYQKEIIVHQLVPVFPNLEYKTVVHYYSFKKSLEKVKRVIALYDYLMIKKEENLDKFMRPYST